MTEKTPQERYQPKPFLGSSHSWAMEKLSTIEPTRKALDIGPGSGAIGQALRTLGFTSLTAIDNDAAAREHVKPIYDTVASSLTELSGQRFGLVIILDVLEHMPNPESFMRDLLPYLEPGAKILISVPNIAHWSVRLPLLFGVFKYTDRGLLDRTHLQFFTRKRVREFLALRPELKTIELNSTIEPAEFVLPKIIWDNNTFKAISRFRLSLAQNLPGFFAYQHLALLEVI